MVIKGESALNNADLSNVVLSAFDEAHVATTIPIKAIEKNGEMQIIRGQLKASAEQGPYAVRLSLPGIATLQKIFGVITQ